MMLKNLLPQDTRSVELASAGTMLWMSVSLLAGMPLTEHMAQLHPMPFWMVVTLLLGILQFVSLLCYPALEALRCWLALIAGAGWIWLGMSSLIEHPSPSDWSVVVMGLSNLYGFSVGFLFLRKSWEN